MSVRRSRLVVPVAFARAGTYAREVLITGSLLYLLFISGNVVEPRCFSLFTHGNEASAGGIKVVSVGEGYVRLRLTPYLTIWNGLDPTTYGRAVEDVESLLCTAESSVHFRHPCSVAVSAG